MFLKKKKKSKKFLIVIYKNDLRVDLNKFLVPDKLNGVSEFLYVLHTDAVEEHYHVYIKFDKSVSEEEVKKLFYNSRCFVDVLKDDTILNTLYYFTDGFRLPFESSCSIQIEERRKNIGK